ncbi:major capsid protein [Dokdonella soli]|uniref:Methyltransferase n=1 Tax=Dokdonella soli TaxID=529810 RepID=A0ABN1IDT6_9GAMM
MFRSFVRKLAAASFAVLGAVAGTSMLVSKAQAAGGLSDGVVATITSTQADIVTIGVAILALMVLVASIAWIKRAFSK